MQALIRLVNQSGTVTSCGPACYQAPAGHAPCICRGNNRGVGRRQAAANTLENWQAWIIPRSTDPPAWKDSIAALNPDLELIATQQTLPFPEPVPAR